MKKRIAVLAALMMLVLLSGCKDTVSKPDASPAGETTTDIAVPDASESDAQPVETTTAAPAETTAAPKETTTAAPVTTTEKPDPASYIKPTEQVTYSDKGIPIGNAYYSLRLPKEWDGHYITVTKYDDDVMWLIFKERNSAETVYGGHLFSLVLAPADTDNDLEMLPAIERLHTMTNGAGTYILYANYPTDVQYEPQSEQQYKSMQHQIQEILVTLEPGAGFTFAD